MMNTGAEAARALASASGRMHRSALTSISTRQLNTAAPSGGCPITGATSAIAADSKIDLKKVPTLPYIGSMIPQYSNTPAFDPTKFYDFYPEMRRRHGDFYSMGIPGLGKGRDGLIYLLTDPNEMQKVIRQERGKYPYPRGILETEWPFVDWLQSEGSILGKGANDAEDKLGFCGRGETWKRLRTFLQTDLLSPQAAAGYIPAMVEAAQLASKGAPASAMDLNGYTNRCSFDLFNSLMFGQLTKMADPETGNEQENLEFCDASVNGMANMLKQMLSPMQLALFKLGIKTSVYNEMAQSFDTAFTIAEKKYHAFRKRHDKQDLTEAEKSSYLGRAIIRQSEEGSNISEQELVEIIKISLGAGVDTTSSMLSWNMVHLALNAVVQDKLYSELAEATQKHGGLNAESLRKANVPYLHAVLRETHRLTPAVPITIFKENSLAEVEIHGSTIPKDSLFALDGYSVGMDLVDEPKEFRPERWLPHAVAARKGTSAEIIDHPFYRDAFSQGSRKCPGSRVANNEALILISQLVLDWKMAPTEAGYKKEDVTYQLSGMIHPDMPRLDFVSR